MYFIFHKTTNNNRIKMVNTKNKSEKVRKNTKKFTKNMSKPHTNSQIFQALVAAEVAFLKTLPEDKEKR